MHEFGGDLGDLFVDAEEVRPGDGAAAGEVEDLRAARFEFLGALGVSVARESYIFGTEFASPQSELLERGVVEFW